MVERRERQAWPWGVGGALFFCSPPSGENRLHTHIHTHKHSHTQKRKGGSVPQTGRRHHRGALDVKAVPKGKRHHKYASDREIHLDIA